MVLHVKTCKRCVPISERYWILHLRHSRSHEVYQMTELDKWRQCRHDLDFENLFHHFVIYWQNGE